MIKLLGLPVEASAQAAQVDQIIGLVHWLMAVLFVGWGAFFIYTLVRFRRSTHPHADYAGVSGRLSGYTEAAVALVEATLLVAFAIPVWASRVRTPPPEEGSVAVRVVAQQFAWNIQYPGPDGKFGRTDPSLVSPDNPLGLDRNDPAAKDDITSINQLVLPVNRPVIVYLSSKDVVHSFSLIPMRVKQDAIPGMTIPVWFTPTQTGNWEINCSQLCGLGHYRMRGFLSVRNESDYDAWLKQQAPTAS